MAASARNVFASLGASLATALTPTLATFNSVTPKDRGGRRVAKDARYGDDPRQTLDVYAPHGAAAAPVIMFIYGGSWDSGEKSDYGFVGAAFASRGFVTVIADYRLVPHVHFPDFLCDGASAARWVRDHIARYGGDPDRIVLVGHSAGAYNAMMIALDPRYLRESGVAPGAIKGVASLAGPFDFLPLDARETIAAFGQASDLPATQPLNFARADAPPILLLHGDQDTKVYKRNLTALARHLRGAGHTRVETKFYPNTAHISIMLALSRPLRGRAPVLGDVAAFARRVTAPSLEPANKSQTPGL